MKEFYQMIMKFRAQIIILVGLYSLFLSCLALNIFWRHFDIDPFDYISIQELAKYGIPYFLSCAVFIVVWGIVHFILLEMHIDYGPDPYINQKFKTFVTTQYQYIILVLFFVIIVIFLTLPLIYGLYISSLIVPLILSISFCNIQSIQSVVPNRGFRWFVSWIIFYMPFYIAISSITSANYITDGSYYQSVERVPGDQFENLAPNDQPIVYIGKLGDTVFVQTLDGARIGVIKPKDGDLIVIMTRKRMEKKVRR